MSHGLILVISAPSGAGKSTLCRALLEKRPRLHYSVSCTTRQPRTAEVDGQDYFFITEKEFMEKRRAGAFVEWARVHGHFYGTPYSELTDYVDKGVDVLLDIDPQGAAAIQKRFPKSVRVFIGPPSWEALEQRLRGRGENEESDIARRLANARREMAALKHYDYFVVNEDLGKAVEDLLAILRAEHRRIPRLSGELGRLGFSGGKPLVRKKAKI